MSASRNWSPMNSRSASFSRRDSMLHSVPAPASAVLSIATSSSRPM
jgi:hypothetical protein